ncbi:hypothetical protein BMF89_02085 [Arthrobacter sp. SRS-W-1-2016]|uniref:hypothetical protein n=1 Tax=Arthrobacter sp. SRS-W-1-2016 TaxID=1930254 RepID=UPI000990F8E8|nr:hypothetical protein [Arthrobacter sp. SRS-W-1-2016]OOP64777.1 hypothetical protein BMF89_02085 [Arthrobacter sp. SRS-W-1-2016]
MTVKPGLRSSSGGQATRARPAGPEALTLPPVRCGVDSTAPAGAAKKGPATPPESRLKIRVRLEPDMGSARLAVHGTVTEANLLALYAVVRRTNSFLPGMEIVIDLSAAAAGTDVLDRLGAVVREGLLPGSADPARLPCRLQVIAGRLTRAA